MNAHLRKLIDEHSVKDELFNMFSTERAAIEAKAKDLRRQGLNSPEIRSALDEDILRLKLRVFQAVQDRRAAAQAVVTKARGAWEKSLGDPQAEAVRLRKLELSYRFLEREELEAAVSQKVSEQVHDPQDVQTLFAVAEDKGVSRTWLAGQKAKLRAEHYDQPYMTGEVAEAQAQVDRYRDFQVGELPVVQTGLNQGGVEVQNHQAVQVDEILDL